MTLPWIREAFRNAWTLGNPGFYGFSHDVEAVGQPMKDAAGVAAYDITKITRVASVDVVMQPAAGGRAQRLVASVRALPSEDQRMKTRMVETIKAKRPDLAAQLGTNPSDELVERLYAEAIMPPPVTPPATVAVPAPVTPPAPTPTAEAVTISAAELETLRAAALTAPDTRRRFAALSLSSSLQGSSLPEAVRQRVRARFEARMTPATPLAQIPTDEEITAAVAEAVTDAAAVAEALGLPRLPTAGAVPTVVETKTRREQIETGINEWYEGKSPIKSFRVLYGELTGDTKVTGLRKEAKHFTEAMTVSSWAEIFGDSVTRRMLALYAVSPKANWRAIAEVTSVTDFRVQRRIRFGGYPNLSIVGEGGPYPALTSPGDEEATFSIAKRGGTEAITIEMIRNDDMNAIRRIPQNLANAAAQTLHEFVWDMLANNSAIYDSVALAASGHANHSTSALTPTSMVAGRTLMTKQADMSSAKRIGLTPRYLIHPIELTELAFQLTQARAALPDSNIASTAQSGAPSFTQAMRVQPICVEYWTDVNNWWLTADPSQVPMIEIAFLDGMEEPALYVQDQPNGGGSMFTNDRLTYKLVHPYGGAVMDYRGFQGNIVA